MKGLVKVFAAGLGISFLGSLPLGTMNIAATHIAITKGAIAGLIYALGSMLVEIIEVRFALVGMDWLAKRKKVFKALELFTIAVMVSLAIGSFMAAYHKSGFSGGLEKYTTHPFWAGVFLSVTNPLHIPFWLGWSTVMMDKKILLQRVNYYNWYVTGIGIGTIAGFMVFIYGGNYFVAQVSTHQDLLGYAIGIVLLFTAALQVKKMVAVV